MMRSMALALVSTALVVHAESLTLISGNGSIGQTDADVRFLAGPSTGDLPSPLTSTNFLNAQQGPAAFIISPNSSWIRSLGENSSAKWIGTNTNAAVSGSTALYATRFSISSPFTSASLTLHYASDDTPSFSGGFFLNGQSFCQSQIAVGFSQEHTATCDVSSLLQVGTNWLYLNITNVGAGSGVLFSATITTTPVSVPTINAGGVVNSASSVGPVAPGSLASVYGAFPGVSAAQATSTPLPTILSGLSIQFVGIAAPILYASSVLANVQVPWELSGQTDAPASANSGNQVSIPQSARLATLAPGIFAVNTQGQGAVVDLSGHLVDASNPAVTGTTYLQIFCTGLGPVTNQPATGAPAPSSPLSETLTTPTLTIGGVKANVLYSGLAPGSVGLYQLNAQVPEGVSSSDTVPVVISFGDIKSNIVTIAVQGTPAPNPTPMITSLSPSSVVAGSNGLTLTIIGTGFVNATSVTFNGTAHTVSSQTSSQLTIALSAADVLSIGSFSVVATNPGPGGGISSPVTFTVIPPTSINLTGTWTGAWGSIPSGAFGTLSAFLTEDLSAPATSVQGIPAYGISGTISLNSSLCFGTGIISGLIAGNALAISATFTGNQTVLLDGYTDSSGTSISTGAYLTCSR